MFGYVRLYGVSIHEVVGGGGGRGQRRCYGYYEMSIHVLGGGTGPLLKVRWVV